MEELSMHILDIVENSTRAGAQLVRIAIRESKIEDRLTITIEDDGAGMSAEMCTRVLDPFFTTKTVRRVGLGLPLIAQAARAAEGDFAVESQEGKGTRITALFRLSHIDRQPLGRMAETVVAMIVGNPSVDFCYSHESDQGNYSLDTREIRKVMGDVPLHHNEVLTFIKNSVNEGLTEIGAEP